MIRTALIAATLGAAAAGAVAWSQAVPVQSPDYSSLTAQIADAKAQAVRAQSLAATAVQPADLAAAAASNLVTMAATTVQFVNGDPTYIPLATLLSAYPCSDAYLGRLAHVSDAWGGVRTTLVCEASGTSYYWRPQRTDYSTVISQASGAVNLIPLQTAPIVYLPTTPTGTVTVNLSTTNVWPGAQFHIYAPSTIGVSGITISGLIGGGTVPLLQGADKIITYTSAGWKSN